MLYPLESPGLGCLRSNIERSCAPVVEARNLIHPDKTNLEQSVCCGDGDGGSLEDNEFV